MVKVCLICEREFEALGNRAMYCPECKPTHIKERAAAGKRRQAQKMRLEQDTKKPVVSIAEQARRAKEAGMTYGQYVAKYGEM